jgi:hypothetical protein
MQIMQMQMNNRLNGTIGYGVAEESFVVAVK